MESVAFNLPLVQSSRDWTPERRAKAAANVERFVLEFATDPKLPSVSARSLRALYPMHATPSLAADVLLLAAKRRWTSDILRRVVRAFFQAKLVYRCRGQDNRCRLHDPIVLHDHTTSHVAAVDAKGVLHVAG
jgi:hypothetical protein